jgi:glutaminyl-peptide cyclotransferase
MGKVFTSVVLAGLILCLLSCEDQTAEQRPFQFEEKGREVPVFNADSAYTYIEQQLNIGPRNPGSEGHREALTYIYDKLESFAGPNRSFLQNFEVSGYDGETLSLSNIIASFNPQSSDRIMLCAHWDTRPRAEHDPGNPDAPILGADDGGSGVGVLLELARIFKENPPPVGVDIVLFDGEDYGEEGDLDNYFLGSKYWSDNQPVENYRPRFGILLDMVGGREARFYKERYSVNFAPSLVDEVWNIAHELGYDTLFLDERGSAINDDHVIVNRRLGLRTINIINHRPESEGPHNFPEYWHTQEDDIDIIDKTTLRAVGEVLAELVYNRL